MRQQILSSILLLALITLAQAQTRVPSSTHPKAPVSAEDYVKRGLIRAENGNKSGAIADFTRAIEINPSLGLAYRNRGFQRLDNADYDLAITDFSRAIDLNQKDEVAFLNRGFARKEKGDLKGAIADFSAAIELDDRNIPAYQCRGAALLQKGQYQSAIYDFDVIIEIDPEDAIAYGNRALANIALGEDTAAERDLARCFALDKSLEPEFKKAANELRKNLEPERLAAVQRRIAVEFANKEKENFDAQVKAAQLSYEAQLYSQAIEFLTRAHRLRPNDYDAICLLGNAHYADERYADAEKWYTLALLQKPDDIYMRTNLGTTFLLREPAEPDRAIKEYRRCLELDPKNKTVLSNMVLAFLTNGSISDAQANLEKLEKIDPSFEDLPLLKEKVSAFLRQKTSSRTLSTPNPN